MQKLSELQSEQDMQAYSNIPLNELRSVENQKNPVFEIPQGSLKSDELYFTVEIPKGSLNKYELRTASGQIILDRAICPKNIPDTTKRVTGFPLHYGISAGRFNIDKDPVDLIVFGQDEVYRTMVGQNKVKARKVRVIGTAKFQECDDVPCQEGQWTDDFKIMAVDIEDKKYGKITDFSQLNKLDVESVQDFFSNYKGAKDGHPQTRVDGFFGKKETMGILEHFKATDAAVRSQEVAACRQVFTNVLKQLPTLVSQDQPPIDERYLECLHRVFDARFFGNPSTIDEFMKYTSYQIARSVLKQSDVTVGTAIDRMAALRQQKKTYYRFVGYDRPRNPGTYASNGSGNLIFEWVKSKDRNDGCEPGFPKQHYEENPIVDL
ncbi:MAG: inorganic diphosphatase [Oligoflexales bacterium]